MPNDPKHFHPDRVIFVLALLVPWLNPFAPGPSPAIVPLLVSMACASLLLASAPIAYPGPAIGALLGTLALGIVFGGTGFRADVWVSLACLLMIAISAGAGSAAASSPTTTRWLVRVWLVAGLTSSLIGLLQYAGLSHHFWPWVNTGQFGEAYANLRQRNQFASLTNIALACVFWMVRSRGTLLAGAVMAALLTAGNAASASRTGLLQVLLIAAMFCLLPGHNRRNMRRLALVSVLLYGCWTLFLPWLAGISGSGALGRMDLGQDGCHSRWVLWNNVWELILERPWTGWGWRELAWAHHMHHFDPRFCEIPDNAHNLPLQLAVELGLPLALAVCGGLAWLVWRARPWAESDATRQVAWAVLGVIGLHSLLEYPLWYGPFLMAFGLAAGLLWPARHGAGATSEKKAL